MTTKIRKRRKIKTIRKSKNKKEANHPINRKMDINFHPFQN